MLKQLIKKSAYRLAPGWASELDQRRWLMKNVRELNHRAAGCRTASDYLTALNETHGFPAWQNRGEILKLMELVEALKPRRACEIGSMEGGTLFLLTRMCDPESHVISLDWSYTEARRRSFPRFARGRQRLSLVEADSHAPSTRRRVEELLEGEPLDFLFIDGDHSLAGVALDFEMFAPLVRAGGIIAFHDIVPDVRARRGEMTLRDSGGVPIFWREVRERYPDCREFIDDPEQDGCGIGIIRWPGRLLPGTVGQRAIPTGAN
jgi:cephalosporin hydroxylase